MVNHLKKISLGLLIFLNFTNLASAETTMSAEGQYIFNSLGFYLGGVLVAFMAAGFCMLESGLVTTKSVSTIAAKNIGKFAICSLVFFFCGYNLAYGIPEGGFIGSFSMWSDSSELFNWLFRLLRLVLPNNVCLCNSINCIWCRSRKN